MWGDSESASKNTSADPILKIRKERFLVFPLACDLVLARMILIFVYSLLGEERKLRAQPGRARVGYHCTLPNVVWPCCRQPWSGAQPSARDKYNVVSRVRFTLPCTSCLRTAHAARAVASATLWPRERLWSLWSEYIT